MIISKPFHATEPDSPKILPDPTEWIIGIGTQHANDDFVVESSAPPTEVCNYPTQPMSNSGLLLMLFNC